MDPTGLLDALLAVAVYPGAFFVALAAMLRTRLAGRRAALRPGGPPPAISLVPAMSAVIAAAMLPVVGSPMLRLPPPSGAGGNVVAILLLLAVAVDLGARSTAAAWLAAAAALPVLALATTLGTLDVETVVRAPGATGIAARTLAAVLLVTASSLCGEGRPAALVSATLALTGAALVIPSALRGQAPVMCAVASMGVVVVSGLGARLRDVWPRSLVAAGGAIAATAATVLALVSPRL
jgi:hypothetical protein